jgi:hypothetical protein
MHKHICATMGQMLQSAVTMPTKNFFPSSLTPARSSHYPFLYTIHKHPLSDYLTGMSFNCTPPNYSPSSDSTGMSLNCNHEPEPSTGMSLNCTSLNYPPFSDLTSMLLNCNLTQTPHDMSSGLNGGLGHLGYWLDDMSSSHPDPLNPFRYLGHLSHLGHLGLLGHLDYLNALNPEPIDPSLHAFIEEEGDT